MADDDLQYLKENLGALKIRLTPEDLREVRRIAQEVDASKGERYPAWMMGLLFIDTPEFE